MPQDTEPEDERREDPTLPGTRVEAHPGSDRLDIHPRNIRTFASFPLTKSEVGDVVAIGGETLAKPSIPPFSTTHGVRKKTVVDQADAHGDAADSHILVRRAMTRARFVRQQPIQMNA
jgi:hypothetical protein